MYKKNVGFNPRKPGKNRGNTGRRFESNASYFEEVDRKALSVLEIMSDGMLVKKVYRGR